MDWKRNLNLVLTAKDCAYVLTKICLSPPDSISTPKEDAAYHKWQKMDKLARCYILASMSNVLQQQHESMLTAYDILLNVKEMFGEQGRAARQIAMKALLNTKMAEGSPVQEHVLKTISHLNENGGSWSRG